MDNGLGENGGWSVERKLLVATFFCSAIGFGFSIGFNWAKLVGVQAEVAKLQEFERSMPQMYVPREVYLIQQQNLTQAIDKLTAAIDRIQEQQKVDARARANR